MIPKIFELYRELMKPAYCGTFIVTSVSTRKKYVKGKKCVNLNKKGLWHKWVTFCCY